MGRLRLALKPGWEPIIFAMKPRDGDFSRNALEWGCGGLNIDACRIGTTGGTERSHQAPYAKTASGKEDRSQWARSGHSTIPISSGRWPANVILDEEAASLVDQQSGVSTSCRSNAGGPVPTSETAGPSTPTSPVWMSSRDTKTRVGHLVSSSAPRSPRPNGRAATTRR